MKAHRSCQHGEVAFHKPLVIAKTFMVTKEAVTLRLKSLPHERIDQRWVFVSDEQLREWIRSGQMIGMCSSLITPERTLHLSCGHVLTDVPEIGIRHERSACRHDVSPALHKVRIIATTYGVSEPTVRAKIGTWQLPTSGLTSGAVVPSLRRPGVDAYVSDDDLRSWIAFGVTFGNGVTSGVGPGTQDHTAKTITLSCGHTVRDVPPEPTTRVRRIRLVRCLHGHASGPLHSVAAVALSTDRTLDDVYQRAAGRRVEVGGKVYLGDAAAKALGGKGRLACGYQLPG